MAWLAEAWFSLFAWFGEVDHDLGEFWWEHAHAWVAERFFVVAAAVCVDVLDGERFCYVECCWCCLACEDCDVDAFFDGFALVDLG